MSKKAEADFKKMLSELDFAERARIEVAVAEIRQVIERHGDYARTAIAIVAGALAEELAAEE